MPPPPSPAAPSPAADGVVTDLHVRVVSGVSESQPEDAFVLHLRFARPRGPLDDAAHLARLERLLAPPTHADVVRIGRAHHLGDGAAATEEVSVSIRSPWQRSREDLESLVTDFFRATVAETPEREAAPLGHDAAIAASLALVCEVVPSLRPADLSVRAEEHVSGRWAVRFEAPGPMTFDVHVGFVDGHPGSAHLRRTGSTEVVDSVGSE